MKRFLTRQIIQIAAVSVGVLAGGTFALTGYLNSVGARPEGLEREVGLWAKNTAPGAVAGGLAGLVLSQLLLIEGRKQSDAEVAANYLERRLAQLPSGSPEAFDLMETLARLKSEVKR